jgi:hypothetical protein
MRDTAGARNRGNAGIRGLREEKTDRSAIFRPRPESRSALTQSRGSIILAREGWEWEMIVVRVSGPTKRRARADL